MWVVVVVVVVVVLIVVTKVSLLLLLPALCVIIMHLHVDPIDLRILEFKRSQTHVRHQMEVSKNKINPRSSIWII